jgi:DNA repair exonuclease SbcCD ATPase subunit
MEAVVDITPKVAMIKTNSGFATRSALEEKIAKEEKELKGLIESNKEKSQEDRRSEEDEEPTNAEEKSFKKRYGDLRRYSQEQHTKLQKQIEDLKTQLESSTKQQIKLPKSEEELEQWASEYPDVAKIVETIAIKKAQEQSKEFEERLKTIDEMQYMAKKEKAEVELMRLHPDFGEIRDTDDFHDWVDKQPKWIQQALYENDTDAVSAARAIDLYKADMGIAKKRRSNSETDREVAKSVRTPRSAGPDATDSGGVIRESEVEKMSAREYETRQEEIVAAIRAGKFIYDLSGSAR